MILTHKLQTRSKKHELLTRRSKDLVLLHLENIESHSLCQWAALPNCNNVTFFHIECWRAVCRHHGMTFLESVKLLDVMQVVAPDGDCALHLCGHDHTSQDLTADTHVACEWTLLVDVFAFLCFFWGREAKTYVAKVSICALGFFTQEPLGTNEDRILLLEGFLVLIHGCGLRFKIQSCRLAICV